MSDDTAARIVETHISRLFFVDDRVIKVKLPITTPFVDLSTVELRGLAAEREVSLNRRLAADVYLGVLDVSMGDDVVEHAVLMRRLPEDRRLARRLDHPAATADLTAIADAVAQLHARSPHRPEIDLAASIDAVRNLWTEGLEQLRPFAPAILEPDHIDRLADLVEEYLDGRGPLFEERIAQGWACDGHGDLQAEDIFCLDDGPRILDCLEFDDHLRFGDALNDAGFLAMDLGRLGHPDLGEWFLAEYRRLRADRGPDSLARHYMAYRAHVRSKVACIRHAQHGRDSDADDARSLHARALALLGAGRVRMVMVGGSPGTGKSTLSRALAGEMGAVRWSTDEIRDELFPGVAEHRYDPASIDAVYRELLGRTAEALGRGEHVVVDGSWLLDRHREMARSVADTSRSVMVELRCTCPTAVAEGRITRRLATGGDPSEATVEVARAMRSREDPWPTATPIDTDRPLAAALDAARRVVTATPMATG